MTATNTNVYKTYMCLICGFIYDEAAGVPDEGIAPGTRWEDVPMNWTCPECGARKEDFEMVQV
jgi:rubredoxin